ncbi:Lysophospholipase L1 [Duganella sacchari]|uniref:Lysophospholipase L1 n=2 Tax=Duganella sacchari TaxID=551987 RepID=A0A1M7REP9_9BURK|nr:Lysophospholipase L1 [Duganella sacchari]
MMRVVVALLCLLASAWSMAAPDWVSSWTAAPDSAGPAMQPQTIRQVVRTSAGGSQLRIRLSNAYGLTAVTIGPVRVARRVGDAAIDPASDRVVRFDGQPAVTIAPGQSVVSDAVALPVATLQELAISLYLPEGASRASIHGEGLQTVYLAPGADTTAAPVLLAAQTDDSRYFLAGVEVLSASDARAVVVLGDSIADGVGATANAYARWPDVLAARLAPASMAVVNAGIAGNRLIRDAVPPFVGSSMLGRLLRDALDQAGVRWIVLHAGSNDINAGDMLATPDQQASAQDIVDGMQTLIRRAHQRGVKVCGATLLPYGGVGAPFVYTAAGEAKRQAVNAWIRSTSLLDAMVDFDAQLRDPSQPERLLPSYGSGDHLHPNDRGYQVMAALMPALLLSH